MQPVPSWRICLSQAHRNETPPPPSRSIPSQAGSQPAPGIKRSPVHDVCHVRVRVSAMPNWGCSATEDGGRRTRTNPSMGEDGFNAAESKEGLGNRRRARGPASGGWVTFPDGMVRSSRTQGGVVWCVGSTRYRGDGRAVLDHQHHGCVGTLNSQQSLHEVTCVD
jgi:hypothetical protein